ncbi:MAG TPA: hypothetical protein PKL73_08245, partial [Polyangiaceae bacterium]|nr:hypothetical protein [Polyangiaceae bacterium]
MKITNISKRFLSYLLVPGAVLSCSSDPETEGPVVLDAATDSSHDGGMDGSEEIDGSVPDVATDTPSEPTEDSDAPDSALPVTCVSPSHADPAGTDVWNDTLGKATVSIKD